MRRFFGSGPGRSTCVGGWLWLVASKQLAREACAIEIERLGEPIGKQDGGALQQMADASIVVPRTRAGYTSTPHVEGFHEIYHHLICERLLQLVAES